MFSCDFVIVDADTKEPALRVSHEGGVVFISSRGIDEKTDDLVPNGWIRRVAIREVDQVKVLSMALLHIVDVMKANGTDWDAPITALNLTKRTRNVLLSEGIETVSDLIVNGEKGLLGIPMFGRTSLDEVKTALMQFMSWTTDDLIINLRWNPPSDWKREHPLGRFSAAKAAAQDVFPEYPPVTQQN